MAAEIRKRPKLAMNWSGPWVVVAAKSPRVFTIKRPLDNKRLDYHERRLKQHSEAYFDCSAALNSASLEDNEVWGVAKLYHGGPTATGPPPSSKSGGAVFRVNGLHSSFSRA